MDTAKHHGIERPDFWTAESAAYETARLLDLIPEEVSSDEAESMRKFAIKIGENLADEIEFGHKLQHRAADLGDRAFDLACQAQDRIVALSPNRDIGEKRAFVLTQLIGHIAEHYTDRLLSYKDYTQPKEDRLKELDATLYFGRGFRDALVSDDNDPLQGQYVDFLKQDPWVFANYFKGYFIARVGIGDPNGIRLMEAVNERLTTYQAPDYHPGPAEKDVLYGKLDRVPAFLSDPNYPSYLPFVAWAATLEEKQGLDTDTKQRFDDAMAHYGYIWDEQNERYHWVY